MKLSENDFKNYTAILREELIPAMGCTEPIAIAYAAAMTRKLLGEMPIRSTMAAAMPSRAPGLLQPVSSPSFAASRYRPVREAK